jgi:hypothetical protein
LNGPVYRPLLDAVSEYCWMSDFIKVHVTSFLYYLVLADDDKNDTVVRAQDISPLDSVKTLSYDELKILMETLEKESTRMSTNASHLSGKLKLSNKFYISEPANSRMKSPRTTRSACILKYLCLL